MDQAARKAAFAPDASRSSSGGSRLYRAAPRTRSSTASARTSKVGNGPACSRWTSVPVTPHPRGPVSPRTNRAAPCARPGSFPTFPSRSMPRSAHRTLFETGSAPDRWISIAGRPLCPCPARGGSRKSAAARRWAWCGANPGCGKSITWLARASGLLGGSTRVTGSARSDGQGPGGPVAPRAVAHSRRGGCR